MLKGFATKELPLLNESLEEEMRNLIREAKASGDSVGGTAEICVLGIPAGVGNPFFDSVELRTGAHSFLRSCHQRFGIRERLRHRRNARIGSE